MLKLGFAPGLNIFLPLITACPGALGMGSLQSHIPQALQARLALLLVLLHVTCKTQPTDKRREDVGRDTGGCARWGIPTPVQAQGGKWGLVDTPLNQCSCSNLS